MEEQKKEIIDALEHIDNEVMLKIIVRSMVSAHDCGELQPVVMQINQMLRYPEYVRAAVE